MEWKVGNRYVLKQTYCAPFSEEVCRQGDLFTLVDGGLFEKVSTKRTYAFPKSLMKEFNPKPEMLLCDREVSICAYEPEIIQWKTVPGNYYELLSIEGECANIKSSVGTSWVPKDIFPAIRNGEKKEVVKPLAVYVTADKSHFENSFDSRGIVEIKVGRKYQLFENHNGTCRILVDGKGIWVPDYLFPSLRKGQPEEESMHPGPDPKGSRVVDQCAKPDQQKDEQKMEPIKLIFELTKDGKCCAEWCGRDHMKLNQFGYCADCWLELEEEKRLMLAGIKIVDRVVVEKRETVTQLLPIPGAWKTAMLGAGIALLLMGSILAIAPQIPLLKAYLGM